MRGSEDDIGRESRSVARAEARERLVGEAVRKETNDSRGLSRADEEKRSESLESRAEETRETE